MTSSLAAKILGAVVTTLLLITLAESGPTNLDCRRFVFAPACRGATIKRSSLGNGAMDAYAKSHVQSKSAEAVEENNDESEPRWVENSPAEDDEEQPGLDNQFLWNTNVDRLEEGQPSKKKITSGQHHRRNLGSRRWED